METNVYNALPGQWLSSDASKRIKISPGSPGTMVISEDYDGQNFSVHETVQLKLRKAGGTYVGRFISEEKYKNEYFHFFGPKEIAIGNRRFMKLSNTQETSRMASTAESA